MIQQIDYERRLSPEEHYCLYIYFLSHSKRDVDYQDFEITEDLIDHYNRASEPEKQEIADKICMDPNYPYFLQEFWKRPWEFEKPVLWGDRKKPPYYIQQLKESHAFEVYIDCLFQEHRVNIGLYYGKEQQYHGETAVGIEIKLDKRSAETGNYYIEYQERMRAGGQWVDSGILKDDDTEFYLLGTIDKFVILDRDWLMDYYNRLVIKGETLPDAKLVFEQAHNTSKGFILKPAASRRGNIPIEELAPKLRTSP